VTQARKTMDAPYRTSFLNCGCKSGPMRFFIGLCCPFINLYTLLSKASPIRCCGSKISKNGCLMWTLVVLCFVEWNGLYVACGLEGRVEGQHGHYRCKLTPDRDLLGTGLFIFVVTICLVSIAAKISMVAIACSVKEKYQVHEDDCSVFIKAVVCDPCYVCQMLDTVEAIEEGQGGREVKGETDALLAARPHTDV